MSAPVPDPAPDRPVRTGAGVRLLALAGLLLGAGLAVVAGAQPWWRAVGEGVSVTFTGTQTTAGLCQALALVVLAGTVLALALRVRGRRVLGVLLALAGAGALALGAGRPRPSAVAVRTSVREVSLADQFALRGTGWPWVFAFAGALVLVAALLMLRTAGRWPARTARFERTRSAARLDLDDPAAVWRSMDAGLDPTLDVTGDTPTEVGGPPVEESARGGVREGSSGATMDPRSRRGRADERLRRGLADQPSRASSTGPAE